MRAINLLRVPKVTFLRLPPPATARCAARCAFRAGRLVLCRPFTPSGSSRRLPGGLLPPQVPNQGCRENLCSQFSAPGVGERAKGASYTTTASTALPVRQCGTLGG